MESECRRGNGVHCDQGESGSLGRRDNKEQDWPPSHFPPMRWGRRAAPGRLRGPSWLRHIPLCTPAPSSLSDITGDQGQVESKTRLVFQKNVASGKDRTRQEGAGPRDLTSVSVSVPPAATAHQLGGSLGLHHEHLPGNLNSSGSWSERQLQDCPPGRPREAPGEDAGIK